MTATDPAAPRFAMVAGEASGDLLGGLLLGGLKARWPALHAAGIGGPRMAAQGFEVWWPRDTGPFRHRVEKQHHQRPAAAKQKQDTPGEKRSQRPRREEQPKPAERRPPRPEKPIDPDSPFAVLGALKAKMAGNKT